MGGWVGIALILLVWMSVMVGGYDMNVEGRSGFGFGMDRFDLEYWIVYEF